MAEQHSVGQLNDGEVLARFDTGLDPATQGFDPRTQARVWATELVRARARLTHYRALYHALLDAGTAYMLENLDERGVEDARRAKLVFTDDPADVATAATRPDLASWTEATLLDRLVKERAILDFFAGVLDELQPAVQGGEPGAADRAC